MLMFVRCGSADARGRETVEDGGGVSLERGVEGMGASRGCDCVVLSDGVDGEDLGGRWSVGSSAAWSWCSTCGVRELWCLWALMLLSFSAFLDPFRVSMAYSLWRSLVTILLIRGVTRPMILF